MNYTYPSINPEIFRRWKSVMDAQGVSETAYTPEVRVVRREKNEPTFGVFFNPNRAKRPLDPKQNTAACPLCPSLEQPEKNIDVESAAPNFAVIPNIFPAMSGHSLAITKGTGEREQPMYTTRDLNGVAAMMHEIFSYASQNGLQAFHNGQGAGASIPNHEHWHLTNWAATFSATGEIYGFENALVEDVNSSNGIAVMPSFPFAHLLFPVNEPERIVAFLSALDGKIGSNYDIGTVPHIIAQGRFEVLVAPYKVAMQKGSAGSGDVAGHIPFTTREEFESATYDSCIAKLAKQLFKNDEINLEALL